MQTFLPNWNFRESARVLDYKRLGKQRVETYQILKCLAPEPGTEPRKGWRNHPAVKMWEGSEALLAEYGQCMSEEWIRRGYNDTLLPKFIDYQKRFSDQYDDMGLATAPKWEGDERVYSSHRSNLLRKDAVHYGQFGWSEDAEMPYFWPTHEEEYAIKA